MAAPDSPLSPGSAGAKLHLPSLVLFVLSLLALVLTWGAAFLAALVGLIQRFVPASATFDEMPSLLTSAGAFLMGLILLPCVLYAWRGINRRDSHQTTTIDNLLIPLAAIILFLLALLAGYWLTGNDLLDWIFQPPLHILAIGLPILLLAYLAVYKIKIGSPQRTWGTLASGAFLSPALIFFTEMAALILVIIIAAVWLVTQPERLAEFSAIAEQLQQAESDPLAIQSALSPYFTNPWVILTVFGFTALFVPLVEELLKPVGVWFLVSSPPSLPSGFALGALCGAGYALFESVGLANSGDQWAALVLARIGTASVHIFTTALSGWALVMAWKYNRYFLLGGVYLFNVLVHGLWNFFTLTIAFNALPRVGSIYLRIARVAEIAPAVLISLAVFTFLGLLVMNRTLRRSQDQRSPLESSGIMPPVAEETNGTDI